MISKYVKGEWNISGNNEGAVYGLSSDEKPTNDTIKNGYKFFEMDTKKTYLYDEENKVWRPWDNNNPNEETGVGLNVAGATVGQTILVTSVDENGIPQGWEPVNIAVVDEKTVILP